jgi:hypothetical protein
MLNPLWNGHTRFWQSTVNPLPGPFSTNKHCGSVTFYFFSISITWRSFNDFDITWQDGASL